MSVVRGVGMARLKGSGVLSPLPQALFPSGLALQLGVPDHLSLCPGVVFSSWGPPHSAMSSIERKPGVGGGVRCRGSLPSLCVSSPCQVTMAELREVQITEEKPRHVGVPPAPPAGRAGGRPRERGRVSGKGGGLQPPRRLLPPRPARAGGGPAHLGSGGRRGGTPRAAVRPPAPIPWRSSR